MAEQLNKEELKAVIQAASALGMDLSKLKDQNPFDKDLNTPKADLLRAQLQQQNPAMAAQLNSKAGYVRSLAAAAFEAGIAEKTNAVHDELMSNSPMYVAQHQANLKAEEERILREMEERTRELQLKRGYDAEAEPDFRHHGKFANYHRNLWLEEQREKNAQNG